MIRVNLRRKFSMQNIKVIGAGLAGSEAAWQLARRGLAVELCEMRRSEERRVGKECRL